MIRDDAYMKNQFSEDSSDYHNYRDSEIDSFNETINYLASKGIYSIRMGKYVNSKMTIKSKYAFDYATSGERSDFLDLWIISRCMFAISTTAGIETVAVAFRKPLLLVDHLPYGDARTGNDKCIEVFKYILDKNNQMISLNDQIELGLVMSKHTNKITANGRNIKNNTSLEILNATQELMSLINGDLQLSKDEEELQEKFWEILKHWDLYTELHGDVHPVISPSYLSKNKEWLLS